MYVLSVIANEFAASGSTPEATMLDAVDIPGADIQSVVLGAGTSADAGVVSGGVDVAAGSGGSVPAAGGAAGSSAAQAPTVASAAASATRIVLFEVIAVSFGSWIGVKVCCEGP